MFESLRTSLNGVIGGVKSEVDQVTKLGGTPTTDKFGRDERGESTYSVNDVGDSVGPSKYREELLEMERFKKEQMTLLKKREREFELQVSSLELENSRLRSENERLQWEPKKARDSMILLLVSLSSAFTLVCFALFTMAEMQMSSPGKKWEEIIQGSILLVLGFVLLFGSVPLTHMSGQYLFGRLGFKFYQPGQGGRTYVVLQIVGWGCYAVFMMGTFHALLYRDVVGMATFSGVMGILAQVVMVSSLLVFRPASADGKLRAGSDGYSSGGSTNYNSDDCMSPISGDANPIARKKSSSSIPGPPKKFGKHSRQPSFELKAPEYGNEFDLWLDSDSTWNTGYSTVKMDTDTALFAAFMLLQSTLVLISVGLGFLYERIAVDSTHRMILVSLSVLLIIAASLLTQGLGGSLSKGASWKAFQPFAGGTQFLIMQGVVWGLFALCVATNLSVLGIPIYIAKVFHFSPGWTLTYTGLVAVLGHFLMILSISFYKDQTRKHDADIPADLAKAARDFDFEQIKDVELLRKMKDRMTEFKGLRNIIGTIMIAGLCNTQYVIFAYATTIFYGPWPLSCLLSDHYCTETPEDTLPSLQKFSICICVFTIGYSIIKTFNIRGTMRIMLMILLTAIPVMWTLWCHQGSTIEPFLRVMCALFVIYNYRTYSGMPEQTGCREWPAFRDFVPFWKLYEDYQGFRLYKDETLLDYEKKDGGHTLGSSGSSVKQAIWGFHPHGIFPTNVIGLPNFTGFTKAFPGYKPTPMTASIIHLTPIMRDVAQWAGVRDVGRASVEHALKTGRSPLLVVGGQSEMFLSKSWLDEIAVHRGHRGFVRMAIRHGVPLVPTFSFGEHKSMDNIYMPRMQAWFKARLGFPIPYFPIGRWYLPITRRTPITLVVGAPIHIKKQNPNPTKEEIEEVHERYFHALEQLFERNKHRAGFANAKIEWHGVTKPKAQ